MTTETRLGPRRGGWLRPLCALARPVGGRLTLAMLAGVGALGCAVGLAATSAWLILRAAQHPPVLYLMVAIVAVRAFGLGRGVFRYAERLVSHDAALRVLADLRVRVYRGLERVAPTGLPEFRSGDLLDRLVSDVDDVQEVFLRGLLPASVAVVVSGGSVGLLWWLLPSAGVVLAVALLLAGVVAPWLAARRSPRAERRQRDARNELSARTVELLRGLPELTAYGALDDRLDGLARVDRDLTRASGSVARASGLGAGLAAAASGLAVLGALVVGVPAVRSGALPGVALGVLVLVPLAAFEAVAGLPSVVRQLRRARLGTGRVLDVLDAPAPVTEPDRPRPLPESPHHLRVDGVVARWPGAARPALVGVDLDLPPGRRVAVVGPSGAGKSTLAAVLLRFCETESGSVWLDGVPTRELAGEDLRGVVGLCAQDAHLFDSTVAENVRLARPDATDEQVVAALGRAGLADWVDALPQGVHTPVGEFGCRVSGGQRQRIALARALLADFPVLVADEPTAHLDEPTAGALTADLLASERTILLVTHRLTGLDAVDEIVVLDAGRVVARGTHAELVETPGVYRRMWLREHAAGQVSGQRE